MTATPNYPKAKGGHYVISFTKHMTAATNYPKAKGGHYVTSFSLASTKNIVLKPLTKSFCMDRHADPDPVWEEEI